MYPLSAFWSSPAMATALAVLDVILAIIVTIDVLLKKSDVRGALGWIGAVWFAPILGSLLYYLFGINRVTRRALKLGRLHERQASQPAAVTPKSAAHIALLSDVSQRVTQNPLTGGNAFKVL
ncbi:MAG TPA: PLDc N-terminal domain-containing protein, partial [Rhizomicrobium sp.]|nr:PLDc N-terminal domain-containing protein [Rhizomicrobium sp.]